MRVLPEPERFESRSRIWIGCAGVLASLILVVLYTRVSSTIQLNSDNVGVLLQAQDFVHGNYLLRGWNTVTHSVYTTELPCYVGGLLIAGFTTSLLRIIPALLFTILLDLSMLLVYSETHACSRLLAIAVTLLLLGLSSGDSLYLLLSPYLHTGTMIMLLSVLVCVALIGKQDRSRWLFLAFLILLTSAVFDDEFAIYVGVLPIIVVSVLRLILGHSRNKRDEIVLAVLAALSVRLGRGIAHWVARDGGFVSRPPRPAFAAWSSIPQNTWLAFRGILSLFGANKFEYNLWSLSAASALIHLAGIAMVIVGIWRIVVRWVRCDDRGDLVPQVLAAGIAIDIVCYLISDRPVNLATTRYLTPVLVYGALVGGIAASPSIMTRGRGLLAGAMAGAYIASFSAGIFAPSANKEERSLASWLHQHGLTRGYGDYWAAGIVTAESGDLVRILQVAADNSGYHPYHWNSNTRWYRDAGRIDGFNFLLLDRSNIAGVSEASALKFFGKPREREQIGDYTVLVWHKRLPINLTDKAQ